MSNIIKCIEFEKETEEFFRRVDAMSINEMNAAEELTSLRNKIPLKVFSDVTRRLADWILGGGDETAPYVQQQLEYARKFVKEIEDDVLQRREPK